MIASFPRVTAYVVAAILAALVCAPASGVAAAQLPIAGPSVVGYWQGRLNIPGGGGLTIGLNIRAELNGSLAATLDSPDQGAMGIPASAVSVAGGIVRVEVSSIGGAFEGVLNPAGTEIVGTWRQGPGPLPLTLTRRERPVLRRPQEPARPLPYVEEEVRIQNAAAGITLAGTLSRPNGPAGRVPAVLLLSGSGAQDRDEGLFGHRPFFVLADHLVRQGIAVLRVDDRGVGGSGGTYASATLFDLADDALAAVDFLKARPEIDPLRVGVLGHSEGSLIAPIVATKTTNLAFLVLLAAPGMTGEALLYSQAALIGRASGVPETTIEQQRLAARRLYSLLELETDPTAAEPKLLALAAEATRGMPESLQRAAEAQVRGFNTEAFRVFLSYDPSPVLSRVACPVLVLAGERDLQVPPKENLPRVASALAAGGNTRVTTRVFPQLNHLFQTSRTGAPTEYAQIEETFAPAALSAISEWILAEIQERPRP